MAGEHHVVNPDPGGLRTTTRFLYRYHQTFPVFVQTSAYIPVECFCIISVVCQDFLVFFILTTSHIFTIGFYGNEVQFWATETCRTFKVAFDIFTGEVSSPDVALVNRGVPFTIS